MRSRTPVLVAGAVALAAAVVALLFVPAPARGTWRAPVDGDVVGRFSTGPDPFAAGQRRGIDLAARPGAVAVAPCSGRVAFAGRLPRGEAGVSVRCGALTATVLGLAAPSVRSGFMVQAGRRVGVVGAAGRVRLGARRTASRFGYVDPLSLIARAHRPRQPPPAGPVAHRSRPLPPSTTPVPIGPARAPAPPRAALAAWIGIALLAVAVPGGAVAGRAHRRRRAGLTTPAAG